MSALVWDSEATRQAHCNRTDCDLGGFRRSSPVRGSPVMRLRQLLWAPYFSTKSSATRRRSCTQPVERLGSPEDASKFANASAMCSRASEMLTFTAGYPSSERGSAEAEESCSAPDLMTSEASYSFTFTPCRFLKLAVVELSPAQPYILQPAPSPYPGRARAGLLPWSKSGL